MDGLVLGILAAVIGGTAAWRTGRRRRRADPGFGVHSCPPLTPSMSDDEVFAKRRGFDCDFAEPGNLWSCSGHVWSLCSTIPPHPTSSSSDVDCEGSGVTVLGDGDLQPYRLNPSPPQPPSAYVYVVACDRHAEWLHAHHLIDDHLWAGPLLTARPPDPGR